ncbi:MAG: acetyltransferase [bacterium ADurb.Bin400]|nr:MAG: acetyltransferase [bacterium ADurb.Bin400]
MIRNVELTDLSQIRYLFEEWISDKAEIGERIQEISQQTTNYFVAIENDRIIGIMGTQRLDDEVQQFSSNPEQALEIISAFVSREARGRGIGKSLIGAIELEAKQLGYKEIIIWSGPKYKETGWYFYDSLPGVKRVGFVGSEDFPVWKKNL